jgi:hypothetical protein
VVCIPDIGKLVLGLKVAEELIQVVPVGIDGMGGVPFFVLQIFKKALLHRSLETEKKRCPQQIFL